MCVVNQPVKQGIGNGWIAYHFMPVVYGQLTRYDG